MALQRTVIDVPIHGSMDASTDTHHLAPPDVASSNDIVFSANGAVTVRNGFTTLGSSSVNDGSGSDPGLGSLVALSTRVDELLALNEYSLHSRNSAAPGGYGWTRQGSIESLVPRFLKLSVFGTYDIKYCDSAVTASGWRMVAYRNEVSGKVGYLLVDPATGQMSSLSAEVSNATRPRCVTNGTLLFMVYADTSASKIKLTTVDPSSPLTSTTADLVTDAGGATYSFDVEWNSLDNGCWLAYNTTAGVGARVVKLIFFNSAGTVSSSASWTVIDDPVCVSLASERFTSISSSTTNRIAVLAGFTANDRVRCRIYDATLAVINTITFDTTHNPDQVTGVFTDTSSNATCTLHVYYQVNGASPYLNVVYHGQCDRGGTTLVTGTPWCRHSSLGSRAFYRAGAALTYVYLIQDSTLQPSYFLARHESQYAGAGRALRIVGCHLRGNAGGSLGTGYLPQVQVVLSGNTLFEKHYLPLLERQRLDTFSSTTTANGAYSQRQPVLLTVDHWSLTERFNNSIGGLSQLFCGSQLWSYGGGAPVEHGFHLYPENVSITTSNGGGSLTSSKTYAWRVYWEWYNAQGERVLSSFAAAVTATLGAGDNTATLTIPTLAHTLRDGVSAPNAQLAIYRTVNTPNDDYPFYRVSSVSSPTYNDPTVDTITFVDTMSDTNLLKQELDYQNSGELDNIAPPACRYICSGKGRVWLSGLEDPYAIWYSKPSTLGRAVEFNDSLVLRVPEAGGAITGLAVINDALVVFKSSSTYILTGEGLNKFGQGSFNEFQLISSEVGCSAPKSIVATSMGIFFYSPRGFHLLDLSMQMRFIGSQINSLTGGFSAGSAVCIPSASHVRFSDSGGTSTWVYDYLYNRWTSWTVGVTSGVAWRGPSDSAQVWYTTNGSSVSYEDPNSNGNTINASITTGSLSFTPLGGFVRVKRIIINGFSQSSVNTSLQVVATPEGDGASSLNVTVNPFNGIHRFDLPTQKCASIGFTLYITLITSSTYPTPSSIRSIGVEVAPKRGVFKLPAAKSH